MVVMMPPSSLPLVETPTTMALGGGSELGGIITSVPSSTLPPPNPSFERTHHGRPLQAFISFWALRALPRCASQLER